MRTSAMVSERKHAIVFKDKHLTVQASKEEADINTIVKRFGLTGQVPTNVRIPLEMDFSENVFDFRSAMNMVVAAEEAFLAMPADVRARFGNDPHAFVQFASDPENLAEARKLGLALPEVKEETPSPIEVVVVDKEVPK